jgi:hypothetical protein
VVRRVAIRRVVGRGAIASRMQRMSSSIDSNTAAAPVVRCSSRPRRPAREVGVGAKLDHEGPFRR